MNTLFEKHDDHQTAAKLKLLLTQVWPKVWDYSQDKAHLQLSVLLCWIGSDQADVLTDKQSHYLWEACQAHQNGLISQTLASNTKRALLNRQANKSLSHTRYASKL